MTVDFFEGQAGTGKTHNMVQRALGLVNDHFLGDEGRLLALTFINGSRRRLQARLSEHAALRRRFECQTFDVFARMLVARRRALLRANTELREQAAGLNEFDGPCFLAGRLLERAYVSQWVAASFPLLLVDEAQDVDEHRLSILMGLSNACRVVAAADEFQCLHDGRDTSLVMGWLEGAGQTTRLTQPRRTAQRGLLGVARSLRDGLDLRTGLNESDRTRNATWYGPGFRLLECPATNSGIVAWVIANELSRCTGSVAILSPDAHNRLIREAIETVCVKVWNRGSGATFGPYPCEWELQDRVVGDALLVEVDFPDQADFDAAMATLSRHSENPAIASVIRRIDYIRRTRGQGSFSGVAIAELVHEAVRNQSRLGFRRAARYTVMTTQRAKNREFRNIIALWPQTATGSSEHRRRMLYNAITRATTHCSVIVIGQGRLDAPPFAPARPT